MSTHLVAPARSPSFFGDFLEIDGARIVRLVDRVTEAHDLLVFGELLLDPRIHFRGVADLDEIGDHTFVGAAMERAFEGGDRRRHCGVHVSQRRSGDDRGEGRRVHAMVGVKHEGRVEQAGRLRVGLRAVEHVKEI